ncbi:precorrin-2 dehydrogenase/sirohydrochlorin ferrochelatase family protein [Methanohalophilus euhalobius]|uniref:precorrin-2 dehydrogenase n=1 Tax=Methanohalophilus euhalobius TaxID=51203 RepID=A0A315A220_9EURY|nr:bifunctional precorrin-2 dehydrogenase/sirohydrochlorin ferrochelatase [Methanohalophilus euhalobius]PQV43644.1 precorrin-2 dehydrogenase/sirohydrochlorin ferrochelatase [Methanohalophilus euhalobius]RNI12645.1 bifunctional precorrin-2 dehydrogenase/sirohydrochlorin ferrochelatase [Methanohalophilus euhalobius]
MYDRQYIPLFLDLSSRKIMIFGGGNVGQRKASLFSKFAQVTVISEDFSEEILALHESNKIDIVQINVNEIPSDMIRSYLEGAFLVIPATSNRELNLKIHLIASDMDIFVNSVDSKGNVIVPSVIKRGPVTVGISTLGHSPALSRYTRIKLEHTITPNYADMAHLQDELRTNLKERIDNQPLRKQILWDVLEDDRIWDAFEESYEKAYNIAYDIMLEHIGNHADKDSKEQLD